MTDKKACPSEDFVEIGPQLSDGSHSCLRHRAGVLEAGRIRRLEDGRPVDGPVIYLKPREGSGSAYDVVDSYDPGGGERSGPAMVATPAYRSGWDQVFGKGRTVGQA
jgi:hypothetical protein